MISIGPASSTASLEREVGVKTERMTGEPNLSCRDTDKIPYKIDRARLSSRASRTPKVHNANASLWITTAWPVLTTRTCRLTPSHESSRERSARRNVSDVHTVEDMIRSGVSSNDAIEMLVFSKMSFQDLT